ncbi:MAG: DUF4214 domain-containing protein [Pseudomonadota bacterium]|nr:DUF4214 domain-containing protein [Pseudomonadota bacterium]
MLEVGREVARRKAKGLGIERVRQIPRRQDLQWKAHYNLSEFLCFEGEDFLRNAYMAILRREPDVDGAAAYLADMRSRRRSKIDVLRSLRFSSEGRVASVTIGGLRKNPNSEVPRVQLPRPHRATRLEKQQQYGIADFLAFHDIEFIDNAYRGILDREPDEVGRDEFLTGLREGRLSRIDVLGALRHSPEGVAKGVPVRGLNARYRMRRLQRMRVIGRIVATAAYLIGLPDLARRHQQLEATVFYHRGQAAEWIDGLTAEAEAVFQELWVRVAGLEADLEGLSGASATNEQLRILQERVGGLTGALESLSARHDGLAPLARLESLSEHLELLHRTSVTRQEHARIWAALDHKVEQTELQALQAIAGDLSETMREMVEMKGTSAQLDEVAVRLEGLIDGLRAQANDTTRVLLEQERTLRRLSGASSPPDKVSAAGSSGAFVPEGARVLDSFYAAFEDRFRGSREEIRERMEIYLPIVREAGAGTAGAPVLDIGCGRGEWLQLLSEHGLAASGIDLNAIMIERCRQLGLDVQDADAIDYLRQVESQSLGAVTGMHIIEHLPFTQLLLLIDESLRVLKPGGVAAFETPNPENITVGACNFYFDPTHLRPLPPEMMRYVLQARGFGRTEILRLHPYPAEAQLAEGDIAVRAKLNEVLYGPQDYAVIGYKT